MDVRERFKGRVASALLMVLIAGAGTGGLWGGRGRPDSGARPLPPKPHHHGTHRGGGDPPGSSA